MIFRGIKHKGVIMDTLKKCFKCNTEKPFNEFYKHKAMGDGHLGKCKECTKKDVKKHKEDNYEKVTAYDRYRDMLPHRILARKQYSKTENGKKAGNKAKRKYIKKYPLKKAASVILNNAVRDGKIIKPKECSVCNRITRIHGHHDDYYKPLDVKWFCPKCHKEYHKTWK